MHIDRKMKLKILLKVIEFMNLMKREVGEVVQLCGKLLINENLGQFIN